jgi:hypothetical protein
MDRVELFHFYDTVGRTLAFRVVNHWLVNITMEQRKFVDP